ncbi:MAG: hypothetical protein K2Y18_05735 [Alphaproteobacteria bacterium]|nr:hypothetical protein [Alphaproteobacteria bacterium]
MTMNIKKTLLSAIIGTIMATQSYSMEELATEKPAAPKEAEKPAAPEEVATILTAISKFRPNSLLRGHDKNIAKLIGSFYIGQAARDALKLKAKFLTGVLRIDCYNNVIRELKISDLMNFKCDFLLPEAVAGTERAGLYNYFTLDVRYPTRGNQSEGDQRTNIYLLDKYTALKVPHLAELHDLLQGDQADVVLLFRMAHWPLNAFEYHISSFGLLGTTSLGHIYHNDGKWLQKSAAAANVKVSQLLDGGRRGVECFSFHFVEPPI